MSFFRRKELAIPPVEPAGQAPGNSTSPRPTFRGSNASTYVPSRDGDPYASKTPSYSSPSPSVDNSRSVADNYSRSRGVGDVYSRGGADISMDRNELFSGYNAKAGSGRFIDGPAPGEENDEDVEGIKKQTRFVKQESVSSSRNALRLAREAEETARNTLSRLGDQSGEIC